MATSKAAADKGALGALGALGDAFEYLILFRWRCKCTDANCHRQLIQEKSPDLEVTCRGQVFHVYKSVVFSQSNVIEAAMSEESMVSSLLHLHHSIAVAGASEFALLIIWMYRTIP